MKLTAIQPTGDKTGVANWLLPDGSLETTYFPQAQFDAFGVRSAPKPHADAQFISGGGGRSLFNTPNGLPRPGDARLYHNGREEKLIVYLTGLNNFGHGARYDTTDYKVDGKWYQRGTKQRIVSKGHTLSLVKGVHWTGDVDNATLLTVIPGILLINGELTILPQYATRQEHVVESYDGRQTHHSVASVANDEHWAEWQTTFLWTFTGGVPAGSDRALFIGASWQDSATCNDIDWDNAGTPQQCTQIWHEAGSSGFHFNTGWYRVAPTTGALQVKVALSAEVEEVASGAISMTDVNQGGGASTIGTHAFASHSTSTTPAVTVTSETNALVVGHCHATCNGFNATSGQTEEYDAFEAGSNNVCCTGVSKAGASSVALGATPQSPAPGWSYGGVGFKATGGGGGGGAAGPLVGRGPLLKSALLRGGRLVA